MIYSAATSAATTTGTRSLLVVLRSTEAHLRELQEQADWLNERTLDARDGPRCVVCGQRSSGRVIAPDGRTVHRWPCWDRLL